MIKVLLDTNVLVSGLASFKHPTRTPAQLLHAWRAGMFELCISEYILIELRNTLEGRYFRRRLKPEDVDGAIALLVEECTIISVTATVQGVATHPEDDLIIAAAISGKVDYLVTGDNALSNKLGTSYRGVIISTPSDFLKILQYQG